MVNVQTILVPVDGSMESFNAFSWACDLAQKYKAEIYLAYVIDARKRVSNLGRTMTPSKEAKELREEAELVISEFKRHAPPMVRMKQAIGVGPAPEAIVKMSEEFKADLIIMGNRGMGLVKRMALGSVSTYVLHHVKCPVLIVKDDNPAEGSPS